MRIKLKKDYPLRHDITIETGAFMEVGEMRAIQLAKGGFCDFDGDEEKAKKKHKKEANRHNKEEAPTIVKHEINE